MRFLSTLRFALLPMILIGVVGCSSSNKGKIEGTRWINTEGKDKEGRSLPPGELRLEFGSDGSLTSKNHDETLTGKYTLGMGDRVTFHFTKEISGSKSHVVKININGDTMTMTDATGEITLKKEK